MSRIGFLFPGQGSQKVGMGRALAEAFPSIKEEFFDRADDILGFDISRLCFEGPDEDLVKTENQQPAIFLVSTALHAAVAHAGLTPQAVAGHSLGEYSALVAAGSISFEEGLRLTRQRGEMMAQVAARTGGVMAAVLGLPAEEVEAVCREAAADGVAEVANYNSPTQIVISGEEEPVRRAMALAKERGAQRAIELQVSAPFHCSLMSPLAEAFRPVLHAADVAEAVVPVVANVDAQYEQDPDVIRLHLVEQLASPVRWTASMRRLLDDGFDIFAEIGPGKVLTGLLRQIDKGVKTYTVNDPEGMEKMLGELGR